ncbi:MAG TPA: TonB-dependent receptor [bacterium]
MRRNAMFHKLTLLTWLCLTTAAFAGTTGKIAGKIIDAKTKEPLIGVNVLLTGTNLGAASKADGTYFILNVSPGVYQVKATMIGYAITTVNNVKVSIDLTTKLDFELSEEAVTMSEVVVVAEKPIIQKDLTSTTAKIGGDEMALLPIEDVGRAVNLQAGVVEGHFRGGRSTEVKYLIDGVAVNDVFSGNSAVEAEVNSIQELQVLSGTFNAEYGEALSGVVNQVTKDGGEHYSGEISGYAGDYVSNRTTLFNNIDHISPSDVYNLQGTLSGPVPLLSKHLSFFASGRKIKSAGYIYGRRQFNPSDSSNFAADNPRDWHIGATGDNEFVPMNSDERVSLQAKIILKVGPTRGIRLNGFYQKRKFREYNHRFKLNPEGNYRRSQEGKLFSASYTHLFSASTFADLLASAFTTENKQFVFENPLDPRYVDPQRMRDVSGNAFLTGGTEMWHFTHKAQTYTAKIDFTSQITAAHLIKFGAEVQQHTLDYHDFQIHVDAQSGFKPAVPAPGSFDNNLYKRHPYQAAAYLQDKIELDYLVVNAGVRFDYFQPDGEYILHPDSVAVLDLLQPPFPSRYFGKAAAKHQFSPRLGVAFPITDRGVVHVSYGHFFQIPPFDFLYRNPNYRIPLTGDFPAFVGSTIGNADLQPQRTTVYEVGLQQQLAEDIGLTLTGYYKDIRNLLGNEVHIKNEFRKFGKYINRDYGDVRGITLALEKRLRNGLGATVDYTYQIAHGNASDPNDDFNKAQANPPIEVNKQLVPLDWDRRHSLNFTVTLGTPKNFIASFIGQIGSGLPYTPSLLNQRTGLENSDNRPPFFNVDLYLTKSLSFTGREISVFLKVFNLFDTANERDVFGDTGRAGYTLSSALSPVVRGVNTIEEYFTRPDFYSSPRQVVVGASFGF